MDSAEFREKGKNLVDYIADYAENLNEKRVIPNTKPDYLRALIPDSPPQTPDTYEEVIRDVSSYIMPGVSFTFKVVFKFVLVIFCTDSKHIFIQIKKLGKLTCLRNYRRSEFRLRTGNIPNFTPTSQQVIHFQQ